jgi:hypothetical protein
LSAHTVSCSLPLSWPLSVFSLVHQCMRSRLKDCVNELTFKRSTSNKQDKQMCVCALFSLSLPPLPVLGLSGCILHHIDLTVDKRHPTVRRELFAVLSSYFLLRVKLLTHFRLKIILPLHNYLPIMIMSVLCCSMLVFTTVESSTCRYVFMHPCTVCLTGFELYFELWKNVTAKARKPLFAEALTSFNFELCR